MGKYIKKFSFEIPESSEEKTYFNDDYVRPLYFTLLWIDILSITKTEISNVFDLTAGFILLIFLFFLSIIIDAVILVPKLLWSINIPRRDRK